MLPSNFRGGICISADVFDQWVPHLNFSSIANLAFRQHFLSAQASGLPGSPRTGALHRTQDNALMNLNGATACPSLSSAPWLLRPTSYSCDEYPFRSTYEGAAAGGTARTYSWCQIALPSPSSGLVAPEADGLPRTAPHRTCMHNEHAIDRDERRSIGRAAHTARRDVDDRPNEHPRGKRTSACLDAFDPRVTLPATAPRPPRLPGVGNAGERIGMPCKKSQPLSLPVIGRHAMTTAPADASNERP